MKNVLIQLSLFITWLCPWIARRTGQTEEQLIRPETKTNEQGKSRASEQPDVRTDSRMAELMINRSTERIPAKNERTKNRVNELVKLCEQPNDRVDSPSARSPERSQGSIF